MPTTNVAVSAEFQGSRLARFKMLAIMLLMGKTDIPI